MSDGPAADREVETPRASINLARVVIITVLAVIVFAGLFVFFGLNDGWDKLMALRLPPLVPVKGTITFGGEPLTRGQIMTQPTTGNWRGSVGFIDETGNFTLLTDLKEGRVEGAYVGPHKVMVQVPRTDGSFGAFAPPSLVPEKYTSFDTTPLTIEVSPSPEKNQLSLVVEVDATHQPPPKSKEKSADDANEPAL